MKLTINIPMIATILFAILFVILIHVIDKKYEQKQLRCQQEVSKARVLAPEQAIVLYEMCLRRGK
jgi:hypothetical protein